MYKKEDNEMDFSKMIKDIDSKKKSDFDIPQELDKRVDDTLNGLKRKNSWYKYPVAVVAALFIILFSASNLFPGFRAFATTIPGLGEAVEWLCIVNDEGIQKAVENGYPNLGPVTVENDGYYVQFENIFVDDTRIRLSVRLAGEKVDKHHSVSVGFSEDIGGYSVLYDEMKREDGFSLYELDIKPTTNFNFAEYLKSHNKLVFKATIMENHNKICDIDNIEVNYNDSDVLYSKEYEIGQLIKTEHGDILFDSIKISPTRTVINIKYGEKNGHYINGLTDLELVDNTGHVYKQDAVSMGSDNVQLFFNDSIYFTPDVKSLTLRYTGYTMAKKEGKFFTIPLELTDLVEFEYMGETIEVTSVKWNNGTLSIKANMPNPEILRIQELEPEFDSSSSTTGGHDNEDGTYELYCSYDEIPKQDEYQVEIMYPKYKVDLEGKIELIDVN